MSGQVRQASGDTSSEWQSAIDHLRSGNRTKAAEIMTQNLALSSLAPFAETEDPIVIAQLGQSLDGRIAAADGSSTYINGPEALDHLHRLRSLVDAVVVGAETAAQDDPSLTVRRVPGQNPSRVVIDPSCRLSPELKLFHDGAAPTWHLIGQGVDGIGSDTVQMPVDKSGHIQPAEIIAALRNRGLNRVLIEGGARTIGRFLEAGLIARLHLLVGPILLGAGRTGVDIGSISSLDQALRPSVATYPLGDDTLFDCDFAG